MRFVLHFVHSMNAVATLHPAAEAKQIREKCKRFKQVSNVFQQPMLARAFIFAILAGDSIESCAQEHAFGPVLSPLSLSFLAG